MKQLNVCTLIPAYNEATHIAGVVIKTQAYLPVIVIDDGSTDSTMSQAKSAGAAVLHHENNRGKGAALRTGLQYALGEGYEAVLTLDADGQHDPTEIPKFLGTYRLQQADLIIGRRSFNHMPVLRGLANLLSRWSFSWTVGRPIPDNQSGYRLISRRLIKALLESQEQGFEFEVEMIVTCLDRNFTLEWIPIRTIYGDEESHISRLRHFVNFLRLLWRMHHTLRRAK